MIKCKECEGTGHFFYGYDNCSECGECKALGFIVDRIIHGDCLEVMKRIESKSVDMILCDLPYGTTQNKWDSIIPLEQLWEEYERVIKDNGAIVLTAQTPFDKVLGVSNLKLLRYEWIWEKSFPTGHLNAKKMPMKAHENVLVFYKKLPTYNPNMTTGHVLKKSRQSNKVSENYGKTTPQYYESDKRYPRSIQRFQSEIQKTKIHPTQKPVALFEYLIKTYTEVGGIVLDNCIGSGTTAIAAINTDRRYLGIELNDKYFEDAKKRIFEHEQFLFQQSLSGLEIPSQKKV